MSGSGKDVSGVVGISRDGVGAGTFPDSTGTPRDDIGAVGAVSTCGTWSGPEHHNSWGSQLPVELGQGQSAIAVGAVKYPWN